MTMQQRPPRVQSVLRGPTEASCLQQAITDGERAAQSGYLPISQSWGRDATGVTLTILYELATPAATPQPAPAPWSQPTPTPQPVRPTVWGQPQAPAAPPPQYPAQPQAPIQRPPLTSSSATINSRVAGAIASIVVFIIAFLVYSALNRALY